MTESGSELQPIPASYDIETAGAAQLRARSRTAVFTAHGMGQQIPFQTMDQVARELLAADARAGNANAARRVRSLKTGDQWLSRIELELSGAPGGQPCETHVYEGYWAPLLEGKVTLRDVIRFLAAAGRNGIRNAHRGVFSRWLFDRYEPYPISVRTLFYLVTALATVASLVVINSTIAVVTAGRALLATPPAWLTAGLFADLTTVFNVVITAVAAFGLSLAVGVGARTLGIRAALRQAWSWVTVVLLLPAIAFVIVAGVSIPLLFYAHIRSGVQPYDVLLSRVAPEASLGAFNAAFDRWAWMLALALLVILGARWLVGVTMALFKDITQPTGGGRTLIVAGLVAALAGFTAWIALSIAAIPGSAGALSVRAGLAWIMLIAVSAKVRTVLVQFVGDVAAYIMPYRLDAFSDLRDEIKARAYKVAHAIYAMKAPDGSFEYDRILIVGHSLGSVVAYDTLNRLIREDEASGRTLDVVRRTPLLLTFGSPLDKTAFIFSLQGRGTSEAREALAASVQPMIQSYDFRPAQWVNIYSPWDIISGKLDFYDPRSSADARKVDNRVDREATTLLVAHTEYWSNPLFIQCLYDALPGTRAVPAVSGPPGAVTPA
jgi:hypothetical protein